MESYRGNPRQQLEEYDEAIRASAAGAWQPAPGWLFPLLALGGPAIVAWSAANGESTADGTSVLRGLSIACWVVAVGAVVLAGYRERANAALRTAGSRAASSNGFPSALQVEFVQAIQIRAKRSKNLPKPLRVG